MNATKFFASEKDIKAVVKTNSETQLYEMDMSSHLNAYRTVVE